MARDDSGEGPLMIHVDGDSNYGDPDEKDIERRSRASSWFVSDSESAEPTRGPSAMSTSGAAGLFFSPVRTLSG